MNWHKETPLLFLFTYLPRMLTSESHLCAVGYFGPNCTLPCRFPNYGAGCQYKCICIEGICDPVTGCLTTYATFAQTPQQSMNESIYVQNETEMNITYISWNTSERERITLNTSMWTGMDVKHKVMLICIVFFGGIFMIIIGIYIKLTASNRAHIQYYKWTRKEGKETRYSNETFNL